MSPKINPQRKRTPFGAYLTELRLQKTTLGTAAAARALRFKDRQKLDNYETGRTKPDDSTLIKMAQLYRVPPEDVLRRAHWPQLILLPLTSVINPEKLSERLIEELEKGLEEKERLELTSFIEELLSKRIKVEQYQ
jgi:transcriptional regulator with XRE-family HTH domain